MLMGKQIGKSTEDRLTAVAVAAPAVVIAAASTAVAHVCAGMLLASGCLLRSPGCLRRAGACCCQAPSMQSMLEELHSASDVVLLVLKFHL
jgi:hypothetical protein